MATLETLPPAAPRAVAAPQDWPALAVPAARPLDLIGDMLRARVEAFSSRTALSIHEDGRWRTVTYRNLGRRAEVLATRLRRQGLSAGDRVAILSDPRPEWVVALFAAWRAGAIVVPLDVKLTASELEAIVADADPRVLFFSTAYASTARALQKRRPRLASILPLEGKPSRSTAPSHPIRRPALPRHPENTALLVYVPGGAQPKGVMVTYSNLLFQLEQLRGLTKPGPREVFLSTLPLNHLLQLTCGLVGPLSVGSEVCFAHTLHPADILQLIRDRGVSQMITVPLFLKLVKGYLERRVRRYGPSKQALFRLLLKISGGLPSLRARRWLFGGWAELLDSRLPRFRHFTCGAAALDPGVARFFERLGLPVYEGYGLTETSPVVAMNSLRHHRAGSVGRALPGVRVRLLKPEPQAEVGEILTQGRHVTRGYWGNPEATRELIDQDGWLHTGDLGRIDRNGFLYIVGRVKELIVLGGGKKVHPHDVEAALSQSPLVKEVCVVGDVSAEGLHAGTEEVCAVVVPQGAGGAAGPAPSDEAVRAELKTVCERLAAFKRPTRLLIQREPLPRSAGGAVERSRVRQALRDRGRERPAPAFLNVTDVEAI